MCVCVWNEPALQIALTLPRADSPSHCISAPRTANGVRMLDCRETVRDDEGSPPRREPIERLLDRSFRRRVQRGGRLVEQQYLRRGRPGQNGVEFGRVWHRKSGMHAS